MINGKLKILFLGATNTGKTTILDKFHNRERENNPTIGIEVTSAMINAPIRFYDMGGSRHWWFWIPENLKHTDLIFLFFDVSNKSTLLEANEIMKKIIKRKNQYRIILVGNKTDLERQIDIFEVYPFIQKWSLEGALLSYIEINKNNIGPIRQVIRKIAKGLLKLKKMKEYKSESTWSSYIFGV